MAKHLNNENSFLCLFMILIIILIMIFIETYALCWIEENSENDRSRLRSGPGSR